MQNNTRAILFAIGISLLFLIVPFVAIAQPNPLQNTMIDKMNAVPGPVATAAPLENEVVVDDGADSGQVASQPSARREYHTSEYDYDMKNIYYLCCQNMTGDTHYLDVVPHISNADSVSPSYPGLNKEDMNDTYTPLNPMNFSFPRKGQHFYSTFDAACQPSCNITVNGLGLLDPMSGAPVGGIGKTIWMSVLFDTDGDYDVAHQSGTIEGRLDFDFNPDTPGVIDPYVTKCTRFFSADHTGQQEEEFMDGVGVWNGAQPGTMNGGQIFIMMWRTDMVTDDSSNVTADFVIYCGFTNKSSWINLPYRHPLVNPVADAGGDQGFNESGQEILRERTDIQFDASASYDPQDDVGQDGLGMGDPGYPGPDPGEDNGNIDDGNPSSEPNYGEVSNLKYKWRWGVGAQESPWMDSPYATHQYILPAGVNFTVYTVTLLVRDPDMHTDSDTCLVKVWADPGVAPSPTIMVYPDEDHTDKEATILMKSTVSFEGYAFDPDPGQTLTYFWDMDNRDPSHIPGAYADFEIQNTMTPMHTFSIAGDYRITLNVYDGPVDTETGIPGENTLNGTDYIILHVLADNTPPDVKISARLSLLQPLEENQLIIAKRGQDIFFNASLCSDPDLRPAFDTDADYIPDFYMKYKWDFGDGKATSWTTDTQVTHNYSAKGSTNNFGNYYSVFLYVSDGPEGEEDDNNNASYEFKVYVNLPPVCEAGPDRPDAAAGEMEIETGDELVFDGSMSYDPNDDRNGNGRIDVGLGEVDGLNYSWDFGDGSEKETSVVVSHTFFEAGTYTVTLRLNDGTWPVSNSLTVEVIPKNQAPLIEPASVSATTVRTYEDVSFDASECYDPDGLNYLDDDNATPAYLDIDTFVWDFGDAIGNGSSTVSTMPTTVFNYTEDGRYMVTLTITDNKGLSATTYFNITVLNRAPTARISGFSGNLTYRVDDNVIFSAQDSYDMDGEIVTYIWTFGDGIKSGSMTTDRTNHTYESPQSFNVTLTVIDNDGAQHMTYMNLVIMPKETTAGGGIFGPALLVPGIILSVLVTMGVVAVVVGRRRY